MRSVARSAEAWMVSVERLRAEDARAENQEAEPEPPATEQDKANGATPGGDDDDDAASAATKRAAIREGKRRATDSDDDDDAAAAGAQRRAAAAGPAATDDADDSDDDDSAPPASGLPDAIVATGRVPYPKPSFHRFSSRPASKARTESDDDEEDDDDVWTIRHGGSGRGFGGVAGGSRADAKQILR